MKFSIKEFQDLLKIYPKNKIVEYIESVDEIAPEKISILLKELSTEDFSYRQILYYLLKSTDNKIFHLMILNSVLKIFTRKEEGKIDILLQEKIEIVILSTDIEEVGDYLLHTIKEYFIKVLTGNRSLIYTKDEDRDELNLSYFNCTGKELKLKYDLFTKIIIFLSMKNESIIFDYFLRNISFFKNIPILLKAFNISFNYLSTIKIDEYNRKEMVYDIYILNLLYMRFKGPVIQSIALEKLYSINYLEALLAAKILFKERYKETDCYCTALYLKNISMDKVYNQLSIHQELTNNLIYNLSFSNITVLFSLGDSENIVDKKFNLLRNNLRICSICYEKQNNKHSYLKYITGNKIYYLSKKNIRSLNLYNKYFNKEIIDIYLKYDIKIEWDINCDDYKIIFYNIDKYKNNIFNNRVVIERYLEKFSENFNYIRSREKNLIISFLKAKEFLRSNNNLLKEIEENKKLLSNEEYLMLSDDNTNIHEQNNLSFTYENGLYVTYSGVKEIVQLKIFNREYRVEKKKKLFIKEIHLNNLNTAIPYYLNGRKENFTLKLHQLSSVDKFNSNMIGLKKFNELYLSYDHELIISTDYFNCLKTYLIDESAFLSQIGNHTICGKKIKNTEKILIKSNNKFLISAIKNDIK